MMKLKLTSTILFLALTSLCFSACGHKEEHGTPKSSINEQARPAPGNPIKEPAEPAPKSSCDLVTRMEVSTAIGQMVDEPKFWQGDYSRIKDAWSNGCTFQYSFASALNSREDTPAVGVTIGIRWDRYSNSKQMATSVRDNFRNYSADYQDLSGLGDDAVWSGRLLQVFKDQYLLTVEVLGTANQRPPVDIAAELARSALLRLTAK